MAVGSIIYTPKQSLSRQDVVDTLTSTAADLPASARTVKLLADRTGNSSIATQYLHAANIQEYALTLPPNSLKNICTNEQTQGLPNLDYRYSNGLILNRDGGIINIILFHPWKTEIMLQTYTSSNGEKAWTGWGQVIVGTPGGILYGTAITNEIPSRTGTKVNKLTLEPGKYILSGQIEYTTSFTSFINAIIQSESNEAFCVNRGYAVAGGGQTPTAPIELYRASVIYLVAYQDSADSRVLRRNILTAVKIG